MASLSGKLIIGDPGALGVPGPVFVLCAVDPDRDAERPARDRLSVRDGFAFLAACDAAGVTGTILAVNMAVDWWPQDLPHAASMHGKHLRVWLEKRQAAGLRAPGAAHSTEQDGGITHLWRFNHGVPSSSAFGIWIARLMGARTIATNARLDPQYTSYHFKWARAKTHGQFDQVFHFGPHSDPRRESFVAGLLPGLTSEDLKRGGEPWS